MINHKRRVLCGWLNLHVGYADQLGEWMMFYCTRCEKHVHPIDPETTEAISRELYNQEGLDYDDIHE